MKRFLFVLVLGLIFGQTGASQAYAASLDNTTRVALHSELRDYISTKTESGVYTFFDDKEGEIKSLRLKKIHPVVFGKKGRYLLCADFVNNAGEDVVVDYVVLPTSKGYLIEKEIEGRRPFLTKIFEKFI